MTRRLAILIALAIALPTATGCRRVPADLQPAAAAAALRGEPAFTTRQNSAVGRQLVEVRIVRRIGRSSSEVEFTWRDTVPPEGQAEAPLRTSMALFRLQENGEWRLATLFRVD